MFTFGIIRRDIKSPIFNAIEKSQSKSSIIVQNVLFLVVSTWFGAIHNFALVYYTSKKFPRPYR